MQLDNSFEKIKIPYKRNVMKTHLLSLFWMYRKLYIGIVRVRVLKHVLFESDIVLVTYKHACISIEYFVAIKCLLNITLLHHVFFQLKSLTASSFMFSPSTVAPDKSKISAPISRK